MPVFFDELCLTFRSSIHVELVSYTVCGKGPASFFGVWVSCFPAPLVEKTVLSPTERSWSACQNSPDRRLHEGSPFCGTLRDGPRSPLPACLAGAELPLPPASSQRASRARQDQQDSRTGRRGPPGPPGRSPPVLQHVSPASRPRPGWGRAAGALGPAGAGWPSWDVLASGTSRPTPSRRSPGAAAADRPHEHGFSVRDLQPRLPPARRSRQRLARRR